MQLTSMRLTSMQLTSMRLTSMQLTSMQLTSIQLTSMQLTSTSNQDLHLFFPLIRLRATTLGVIKLEKFELNLPHISVPCSHIVGSENRTLRRRKLFQEFYPTELTGHRGIHTRNLRLFCSSVGNRGQFLHIYQTNLRKAMEGRHQGYYTNMRGCSHRSPSRRKDCYGRPVSRNPDKHTCKDRIRY